ncbi:hypothetical protein SAY87_017984 [Trapa incisa]|uniref:PUM-HD domain-containing protein n=1 Tax=Trapa incisa TaxID=236973 RepID=A0AAN7QTD5_9MYRT|nr:hypothetical protein SAY87_017984 [Trapa incisa]
MDSSDIPGKIKVTSDGFQLNHSIGLPVDGMKLFNGQFRASPFPRNLEDSLANMSIRSEECQESALFSAQSQSIFSSLNGAKTGLQNAEDYFNSGWLLNGGVGCFTDPHFPVDIQSPAAYPQPRHMDGSQFAWMNIEEEWLYKMFEERKPHHQLQQNHQYGVWNPLHGNSRVVPGLTNQYQGHCLQSCGVPRQQNQSSMRLSYGDPDSTRVLDKFSQLSCSGKIVSSRSNGLNTSRAMRLEPVQGDEPLNNVVQNPKFMINGPVCHSSSVSNSRLGSLTLQSNINGLREVDNVLLPSLNNVRGCVYWLAKDQKGCRYLQQKFSEGSPKEIEIIFDEVLQHVEDLMTDPFGNYFMQKLFQVCDENRTMLILREITQRPGTLIRISCDMHGTRSVQKIIESLKTPEHFSILMASLRPGMVTLMKNTNGNHVTVCCLEHLAPRYREVIFEVAALNCIDLASDRFGCVVLQKCLGHPGDEQRHHLIWEIVSNSLSICQNKFGNYVIQYVLLNIPEAKANVLSHLEGHYVVLSMQKYSSNVIEKCIECAGQEHQRRIINELITSSKWDQVMQDPYGNYVIQAALNSSKGEVKAALLEAMKPHIHALRANPYGRFLSRSCLKNLYW